MKAADYGPQTPAIAAFVATNSICQGRQVDTLWSLIFSAGYEIAFAHTSFKWANLASYNAGVTVVIVGISNHASKVRRLFSAADDGAAIVKTVDNINAYLVPGPNVVVAQLSRPLSNLHEMNFGNMPNDGGHLLLTADHWSVGVAGGLNCESAPSYCARIYNFGAVQHSMQPAGPGTVTIGPRIFTLGLGR